MKQFIVILFVVLLSFVSPPVLANADTVFSASNRAQDHVQYPGCGDGLLWGCIDSSYTVQWCNWDPNGALPGYWNCFGQTKEIHLAAGHICNWYVHIWGNTIHWWYDPCRNRHGYSRLG